MTDLYYNITGITDLESVTISSSYGSPTAMAVIETQQNTLSLGDHVIIDIGLTTKHDQLFQGYIKSKEYKVPSKTYTYTLGDDLVRAEDNYIVSADPSKPLTYQNISAEDLIADLLNRSGLSSHSLGTTNFTFGINNEFEVNQVTAYDYIKSIADLLAWHIWCDENGVIQFKNRKPYPMLGGAESSQPGYVVDSGFDYTSDDLTTTLSGSHSTNERNLRNRVIVYGAGDIYAEAKDESSPYFHWKTAVLGAQGLLDSQDLAQKTADYNLLLFNKITDTVNMTVVGDTDLKLFNIAKVNSARLEITNEIYFIFGVEHRLSRDGYTTSLELRKS